MDILTPLPKLKGAYIVGGSIRDLLLGHPPSDYDLAVLGRPEDFAAAIAHRFPGRIVRLGRPGQWLFRIVSSPATIDISPVKGEGIEADLGRRDFTVNAMAYDLFRDTIIDPWGGRADLSRGVIRMVSEGVFVHDPVRLLRAFRLAGVLNFTIDPNTASRIRQDAFRIRTAAAERIRDELVRLFKTSDAFSHLSRMAANGLIFSIFPELSPMRGCPQNRRHEWDVFAHTLKAFSHLERLLDSLEEFFPENIDRLESTLSIYRQALLKCAILFHDIEKPSVRTEDAYSRVHFYRHEKKSAETAEAIGRRLRFSNHDIGFLKTVILLHLRPLLLFQAHLDNRLTPRAVNRFFMAAEQLAPAVLLHAAADFRGKTTSPQKPFDAFARGLIHRYYADYHPKQDVPRLITGNDLIGEFGLTPSPKFQDILSTIEEARLSDRISTRQEALALVKKILHRRP